METCVHFGECSGCDALDIKYKQQLKEKDYYIQGLFEGYHNLQLNSILPAENEYYYRHKVQLPFGHKKGKYEIMLSLGLHSEDMSRIIDMKECRIQDRALTSIALVVRDWAREEKIPPYNEKLNKGFLKYLLLRKAKGTGEILVGLITHTSSDFKKGSIDRLKEKIVQALVEVNDDSNLVGIIQNINMEKTTMVLGKQDRLLYGRKYIEEIISGLKFHVELSTFVQVNPAQTENLYNIALDLVNENSRVIDAYCGIGTISLLAAGKAREVLGIESNQSSIKLAKMSATRNSIYNVRFLRGDSGRTIQQIRKNTFDTLIVDPPRSGLDRACINAVLNQEFSHIIYISCNPVTLEENAYLLSKKYKLVSVQPVDMFPHTSHIESVSYFLLR